MMPAVARYGVYLHILWLSVAWYWLMTVAVGSLYGSLMILLLAVRLRSSAAKASRPHSGSCVASATSGLRSGHCGSRGPRPATPHGRAARQHYARMAAEESGGGSSGPRSAISAAVCSRAARRQVGAQH